MKTKRLFFLIVLCWAFTACDNMTEEIYIEEDGSGKYEFYTDMIPSMLAMQEKMEAMFADSTKNKKTKTQEELEAEIWEDFPEVLDSTINLTEKIPEEVKNDPEKAKMISKARGYMKGGKSLGYMNTGLEYQFDDFVDLQIFMDFLGEQMAQQDQGMGDMEGWKDPEVEVIYAMKGNKKVGRTFKLIKEAVMDEKNKALLDMMMGEATYQTIVYLPRTVKKVKGKHVKSIEDKKVVFEYDLKGVMMGTVDYSFEIIMKKK